MPTSECSIVLASTMTFAEEPRITIPPFDLTLLPRKTTNRFIAPLKQGSVVQLPGCDQSMGGPCSFVRLANDHGSRALLPPGW